MKEQYATSSANDRPSVLSLDNESASRVDDWPESLPGGTSTLFSTKTDMAVERPDQSFHSRFMGDRR